MTIVTEKSKNTPDYLTSNMPTVGIRVHDNDVFAEICKNIEGHVLATTSANISGEPPALTYDEAIAYIGKQADCVVPDYGCNANGRASTVVGLVGDDIVVYRQGDVVV